MLYTSNKAKSIVTQYIISYKKRFYNLFWGAKEKRKLRVLLAPTFLYKKRHIE